MEGENTSESTKDTEEYYAYYDYAYYDLFIHNLTVASRVWKYGGGLIIVFGTIGNILSLLVMMRKKLRKHTTSLYLVVLAVVDTLVLYTGLMRYWIREIALVDVRSLSNASCKIHICLVYFLMQFEAWILVWVAIERLGAIYFPTKAKILFTRKMAALQLSVTGVILFAVNSHFFFTHTLVELAYCQVSDEKYFNFIQNIWAWLDFVLASFAPFVLMLALNAAIISRLVYIQRLRSKNTTQGTSAKMTSMTGILLTINFVFFLTTAPIAIYLSTETHWRDDSDTLAKQAEFNIVWAAVNMAAYTNNAINFILYCVSGPIFRRELLMMLHLNKFLRQVYPDESNTADTVATNA